MAIRHNVYVHTCKQFFEHREGGRQFTSGHQMDLSKARVMDFHPHAQTCGLLESWHAPPMRAGLSQHATSFECL